jgi:hypothetical protein
MAKNFKGLVQDITKQKTITQENIRDLIVIDPNLQQFIRPLTTEEFAQLEENILAEGCRDPLVLWEQNSKFILVDGHNRFRICQKHLLPFQYQLRDFIDLAEAKDWMITNQLGKRNLTEEQKSYYRGLQYRTEKSKTKNISNLKQFQVEGEKVSPSGKTSERLAEQYKVSEKTIKNDEKYAEGLEKITAQNTELKWQILNNEIDLPKTLVMDINDKPNDYVQDFRQLLEQGNHWKNILKKLEEKPSNPISSEISNNQQVKKYNQLKKQFNQSLDAYADNPNSQTIKQLKQYLNELEKLFSEK